MTTKIINKKQYSQLRKIEIEATNFFDTKYKRDNYKSELKLQKFCSTWEKMVEKLEIGFGHGARFVVIDNGNFIEDFSHGYNFYDLLA